jgi:AcrR family transcriptional regulator
MVKMPVSSSSTRGGQNSAADRTRAALIHAGLKLFGSQGFGATSTREIAALAKANIGSIAYHFGGKDGLHAACADYIVETIQAIAGPALAEAATSIKDAESAKARLSLAIERMVSFLVARPEAGDIAQFVMREMSQPSPALDRIYAGVFEPTHRQLCQIWQQATGEEPESEATKIAVFTLIGQIVYFRIAREAVMRRLGWAAIGPKEATAITDIVKSNLDAILTARKGPKP